MKDLLVGTLLLVTSSAAPALDKSQVISCAQSESRLSSLLSAYYQEEDSAIERAFGRDDQDCGVAYQNFAALVRRSEAETRNCGELASLYQSALGLLSVLTVDTPIERKCYKPKEI